MHERDPEGLYKVRGGSSRVSLASDRMLVGETVLTLS